jgi:hypothetical protein
MNYIVLLYLIIYVGHKLLPIIQLRFHVQHWQCKELIQAVRSFFLNFHRKFVSNFYIEFLTRNCLPWGNWSHVSYQPCVYHDVWDLMVTFYISRTTEQRKVCLYIMFIYYYKFVCFLI